MLLAIKGVIDINNYFLRNIYFKEIVGNSFVTSSWTYRLILVNAGLNDFDLLMFLFLAKYCEGFYYFAKFSHVCNEYQHCVLIKIVFENIILFFRCVVCSIVQV